MLSINELVEEIIKLDPEYEFDRSYDCHETLEIMRDPVMTVDGQIYDRAVIQAWFNQEENSPVDQGAGREHPRSPLTMMRLENKMLTPAFERRAEMIQYLQNVFVQLKANRPEPPVVQKERNDEKGKGKEQEKEEENLISSEKQPAEEFIPPSLDEEWEQLPLVTTEVSGFVKALSRYQQALLSVVEHLKAHVNVEMTDEIRIPLANMAFMMEADVCDPAGMQNLKQYFVSLKSRAERVAMDEASKHSLREDLQEMSEMLRALDYFNPEVPSVSVPENDVFAESVSLDEPVFSNVQPSSSLAPAVSLSSPSSSSSRPMAAVSSSSSSASSSASELSYDPQVLYYYRQFNLGLAKLQREQFDLGRRYAAHLEDPNYIKQNEIYVEMVQEQIRHIAHCEKRYPGIRVYCEHHEIEESDYRRIRNSLQIPPQVLLEYLRLDTEYDRQMKQLEAENTKKFPDQRLIIQLMDTTATLTSQRRQISNNADYFNVRGYAALARVMGNGNEPSPHHSTDIVRRTLKKSDRISPPTAVAPQKNNAGGFLTRVSSFFNSNSGSSSSSIFSMFSSSTPSSGSAQSISSGSALGSQSVSHRSALDPGYDYLFRILVVGDRYSGKTSLILRYADDVFSDSSAPIRIREGFKTRTISIEDKTVKLVILDPQQNARLYGIHLVIIAFDVTNRASFENVSQWLKEIDMFADPSIRKVLVATQCDKIGTTVAVPQEEIQQFAQDLGLEVYFTSAQDDINVQRLFEGAVKLRLDYLKPQDEAEDKLPQAGMRHRK